MQYGGHCLLHFSRLMFHLSLTHCYGHIYWRKSWEERERETPCELQASKLRARVFLVQKPFKVHEKMRCSKNANNVESLLFIQLSFGAQLKKRKKGCILVKKFSIDRPKLHFLLLAGAKSETKSSHGNRK